MAATAVGLAGAVSAAPSGNVPRLDLPHRGLRRVLERLRRRALQRKPPGERHHGRHGGPSRSPRRPGRSSTGRPPPSAGCMLYLYGKSGTTYLYIHLNNDVTKGNDNRGKCVAGHGVREGPEGRRVGRGRSGDRLRRQLGRRGSHGSAPPLRGAPERRRCGEPVPVPQEGRAPHLSDVVEDDRDADGHRGRHEGGHRAAHAQGVRAPGVPRRHGARPDAPAAACSASRRP